MPHRRRNSHSTTLDKPLPSSTVAQKYRMDPPPPYSTMVSGTLHIHPPPPADGWVACGGWGACSFVDGKLQPPVHTRWRRGLPPVSWVPASLSINHQRPIPKRYRQHQEWSGWRGIKKSHTETTSLACIAPHATQANDSKSEGKTRGQDPVTRRPWGSAGHGACTVRIPKFLHECSIQ